MMIKEKPITSKEALAQEFFSSYGAAKPDLIDQTRALDLALRVLTMTCCSHRSRNPQDWPRGYEPIDWRSCDSAIKFMELAIPQVDPEPLRLDEICDELDPSELTAIGLELLGLELVGTDDLRKHMLLDQRLSKLHVFHFASFLKESLRETREDMSGVEWVCRNHLKKVY